MSYLHRLSPPSEDGPFPSEKTLVKALRHHARPGDVTVHVYPQEAPLGRTPLGTMSAEAVLMCRGVDHEWFRE